MKKTAKVRTYPAVLNPSAGDGYEVSFPDFPGCVTFGDNFEEALNMGAEALSLWIEELEFQNQSIPAQGNCPIIAEVKIALA